MKRLQNSGLRLSRARHKGNTSLWLTAGLQEGAVRQVARTTILPMLTGISLWGEQNEQPLYGANRRKSHERSDQHAWLKKFFNPGG